MRVDVEPADRFLQLMRENRPCPSCGSARVTVRQAVGDQGLILRSECSDCHRIRDVPASDVK